MSNFLRGTNKSKFAVDLFMLGVGVVLLPIAIGKLFFKKK